MTGADHRSISLGAWHALVRRIDLPQDLRAAALTLASYASNDGGNIRPGLFRLAVDLRVSYATARRLLDTLRSVGLFGLERQGNRRRGEADTYRLAEPTPDQRSRIGAGQSTFDVLSAEQYAARVDQLTSDNRSGQRNRRQPAEGRVSRGQASGLSTGHGPSDARSALTATPDVSADRAAPVEESALTPHGTVSADSPISAQIGADQRSRPRSEKPPPPTHTSQGSLPPRGAEAPGTEAPVSDGPTPRDRAAQFVAETITWEEDTDGAERLRSAHALVGLLLAEARKRVRDPLAYVKAMGHDALSAAYMRAHANIHERGQMSTRRNGRPIDPAAVGFCPDCYASVPPQFTVLPCVEHREHRGAA